MSEELIEPIRMRWHSWAWPKADSVNRRIFRAAVVVGMLTLCVKLASMGKEMVVAGVFGTGDMLDAFLIAFLLPSYVISVIAGSFSAALVPIYIEVRERDGHDAAQQLFSGTVAFSLILLGAATIALAFFGSGCIPLLCSGFAPEKLLLTQRLFYIMLPALVISGLATNWESILNAGERFGITALAPVFVPLATIVLLALGGRSWGIYALAFGTLSGMLLQLFVVGAALKKRGVRLRPRWLNRKDPAMKRVIAQYLPMVAGSVLMGSTAVIDQSMAALLPPGSVATLNYGSKLVALVLGIGTMALGTAVLPYLSKMVAASDWQGLRHTLKTYSWLILTVTIPLTFLACLFSKPLVGLLFQRGNFTEIDTLLVSKVQLMLMLQVPFFTIGILFVRMISALQANHILMWGTVISCGLNISLNYLLMSRFGVAGIALSTTFVYVVSSIFLATMLNRKLRALRT